MRAGRWQVERHDGGFYFLSFLLRGLPRNETEHQRIVNRNILPSGASKISTEVGNDRVRGSALLPARHITPGFWVPLNFVGAATAFPRADS